MYKYIGNEESSTLIKHFPQRNYPKLIRNSDFKMRKIYKLCNPPADITIGTEGNLFQLKKKNISIIYSCFLFRNHMTPCL